MNRIIPGEPSNTGGGSEIRRENQLRLVRSFIPLFTRFFPKHPRWLALGFLNHHQYHIGPPSGSPLKPGPHEDVRAVELISKNISW